MPLVILVTAWAHDASRDTASLLQRALTHSTYSTINGYKKTLGRAPDVLANDCLLQFSRTLTMHTNCNFTETLRTDHFQVFRRKSTAAHDRANAYEVL